MVELEGERPLVMQLTKTAEADAIQMFGSIEDFEERLNNEEWNVYTENEEVMLVSYKLRITIVCVEKPADQTHPEPYLLAKYLRKKSKEDGFSALAFELERPIEVHRAKPSHVPLAKPEYTYHCPYCSSELEFGTKTCPRCHVEITWQCSRCGAIFDVNAYERCPVCGVQLQKPKKRDPKDLRAKMERRFWAFNWTEDKLTGFITNQNAYRIVQSLEEGSEEYNRVMDALYRLYVNQLVKGSVHLTMNGQMVVLMGEMDKHEKEWVDAILKEMGMGRFLDEYEVKYALKIAKKERERRPASNIRGR
jgi:rubrerythrin